MDCDSMAARSSEMMISYRNTVRCQNPEYHNLKIEYIKYRINSMYKVQFDFI